MTPARLEPATFRRVAQRLKHCATAVRHDGLSNILKHVVVVNKNQCIRSELLCLSVNTAL